MSTASIHWSGKRRRYYTILAVSRIASLFIRQIMLRIEPEASLQQVKAILRAQYLRFNSSPDTRSKIAIHYDVDPM